MINNEQVLYPIFNELNEKIIKQEFVTDKSGVKTVEIIGANFILNPAYPLLNFGPRKTPVDYVKKETEWYDSQDLNIEMVKDIAIWRQVADKDGKINSNYGWCIYSEENGSQYKHVLETLIKNPTSRQAIMIYNRPSMHTDWNKNGMSDFICTMYQSFYIRDNKLHSIYNFRSQDAIYGFFSDFPWACEVQYRLLEDLQKYHNKLKVGNLIWFANSFHVYERHFKMLNDMIEWYRKTYKV